MSLRMMLTGLVMALLLSATAWADYDLPVANGVITSRVGWRADPFGSGKLTYHRGIDIAVPVGTPVRATRPGIVTFSGVRGGYGALVEIEHANGARTLYGHNSAISAKVGQRVDAGSVIAFAGNSGRSTGPHVHYEIISPYSGPKEAGGATQADSVPSLTAAARISEEHKLDDAVNSLLRRISASSVAPDPVGEGG